MRLNSIGFIGGGRITRIFLQAFKNKSVQFETVKVFEPNAEVLNSLTKMFPEVKKAEIVEAAGVQSVVVLAVHPPLIMETMKSIADVVDENAVVISLAPKITIGKMASILPTKKIVRMIPNATSFVNAGYNPVAFHDGFELKDRKQIKKLFKPLGKIFETEESKLESYAIISAMLPTYFWFQWREIERIAVVTGLSLEEARNAIKSTMKRAVKLYYKSGMTPEEVIDLIPIKPIGEVETEITDILDTRLMALYGKIKPN